MAKRKVCKSCRIFFDGNQCPVCKMNNTTTNWKGRLYIIDPDNSEIAKKVGLKVKGEYAIKIR